MQPTDSSLDQRYGASTGNPNLEAPPTGLIPDYNNLDLHDEKPAYGSSLKMHAAGIAPIASMSSVSTAPVSMSPVVGLEPTESMLYNNHPNRFSLFHFNRSALLITIATVSLMALIGLASLIFTNLNTKAKTTTTQNNGLSSNQYAVSNLPLDGLNANGQLVIGKGEHLTINGQVLVNSTLSATGLTTLSGGATITGPTTINTTGSDNTSIGNAASTIDLNGPTTINSTLAVQSAGGLTIGSGNATGKLILRNARTPALVSFQPSGTQANNLSLIVPPDINANDSLCLATLANCTAVGTPNGDLTGTYPSPNIAKLQGKTLTISATPTTNAVLQYNGTAIVDGLITNTNLQAGNFTNITGIGILATGSINTGFGTINTTNNITTTANVQGGTITATSFTGNGANLTSLNATNISSGTVADARLSANVPLLGVASQTFTGANTFSSASNSFTGNGAGLTSLNATNISSGTVADARLTTNVTLQGNTFNGASQLVQTTAGGILPILSGANLISLNGTNISSGTVADARLTTNVTLQGNTFNGVSQLVQTTVGGILPVLIGANLTSLNGTNISSGTVADARLSANVALLNATQTFTSANTFSSALTSGITGTNTGSILFKGSTGASGTLTLIGQTNPTNNTLTLPNETGTICTTGSVCSGYAPSTGSGNYAPLNGGSGYLQLQATTPGTTQTGNSNISGTSIAGTFSGSGTNLTSLNGTNISSGTIADARLTTNVTLQGNTFNGVSQLVQTTAGGILPVLSGANLTNLNGTNISSGTVADARLTTNVTLQGNTFNGVSQLVQTTAGGILPILSGANLTSLNGTNIASGTVADARLTSNVTLQGNTFNGASQLLQLTAGGIIPILSGANLTSLNGTNIASGTVSNAYLVNSGALTVTAGSGLSGGGAVALGGTISLTNSGVLSVAGTANQITVSGSTGAVTFSLPQNIAVTSSPTFAGLTVSGNASVTSIITAGSYSRSCPTGYVPVPGNPKFGTSDFCVMKYDASNDGAGSAVSVPNAAPWVNISQITSEDTSRATGGHLLSEAEWMTIATNALWVNANWCSADGSACGNAPGTASKILAAGHNDNSPAAALVASSDDNQACFGTITAGVNTVCGSAGTQKRTLTLSNGSVIWDIPGNVWEWTSSWIIGNEQPTVTATPGFGWREYTALTRYGDLNYANPTNRGWNSTQGLGQIYSDGTSTNNTLYGFIRGGAWNDGSNDGAFSLHLSHTPTDTNTSFGFRVAR